MHVFETLGTNLKLLMSVPIYTGEEVIYLEQLIVRAFEQSLVGGAFIFLLWYVLHKQDKQLTAFSQQMMESNIILKEISERLLVLENERKDK